MGAQVEVVVGKRDDVTFDAAEGHQPQNVEGSLQKVGQSSTVGVTSGVTSHRTCQNHRHDRTLCDQNVLHLPYPADDSRNPAVRYL